MRVRICSPLIIIEKYADVCDILAQQLEKMEQVGEDAGNFPDLLFLYGKALLLDVRHNTSNLFFDHRRS